MKVVIILLIIGIIVFGGCVSKPAVTKEQLLEKFSKLKAQYDTKKSQGYDVTEVETLVNQAKQAYDNGDYKEADRLLDEAFTALEKATATATTSMTPKLQAKTALNNLSKVRVAIVYEWPNDGRPTRTMDEQLQIIRDTRADMIFMASWRWSPRPNSCSIADLEKLPGSTAGKVTPDLQSYCKQSGYSFEDMKNTVSAIKQQNPNIIIIGGIPSQRITKNGDINDETGETFDQTQTWTMALDPAKWGITSVTKDKFQSDLQNAGVTDGIYPDITNPTYHELLLSWGEKEIDSGMDGVWVDFLYTQSEGLNKITKDVNHPAVKESYDAASKIVDELHSYGASKGRRVYVGTWTLPVIHLPYAKPNLDFVGDAPSLEEVYYKSLDDNFWNTRKSDIESAFRNIPVFAFIDWNGDRGQLAAFSQMSTADQNSFLRTADSFFTGKGINFMYPVHGGDAYHTFPNQHQYDSLTFNTYDTIKELAQAKSAS